MRFDIVNWKLMFECHCTESFVFMVHYKLPYTHTVSFVSCEFQPTLAFLPQFIKVVENLERTFENETVNRMGVSFGMSIRIIPTFKAI